MKALKFYADWCMPCKMLSKTINEAEQLPVEIPEVNIDVDTEIAAKYNVRSIPTMVLLDDSGAEVKRKLGAMNLKELKEFLS